jgi:hypothetical protein
MMYSPDALEATRSALQAALAACEAYDSADSAPLDEALTALEQATSAMRDGATEGEVEDDEGMDMSKMDMAAKSPKDRSTLKAKLAKAAFGGYGG